jgi:hypothetical protein
MNYQEEVLNQLKAQTELMRAISNQLRVNAPASPGYRRPLADYKTFDFSVIGAAVIKRDGQGATEVEWMGHRFFRRSVKNKFEPAIWFSRAIGQSEDGTQYATLIKFSGKGHEAEPIPAGLLETKGTPKP